MARLGRARPQRPIIGRAQLIPVAPSPIARSSYVVKSVDTGRRVKSGATYGRAVLPPVAAAIPRYCYVHKEVRTERPKAKATYGRIYLPVAPLAPIIPTCFIHKPVFTGRVPAKVTIIRPQLIPESAPLPPVSRSQYIHKPVFTGRAKWKVTIGQYYRIQRVACPIEIALYNPAALAISLANPGNCSIGLANPGNCSISLEVCG